MRSRIVANLLGKYGVRSFDVQTNTHTRTEYNSCVLLIPFYRLFVVFNGFVLNEFVFNSHLRNSETRWTNLWLEQTTNDISRTINLRVFGIRGNSRGKLVRRSRNRWFVCAFSCGLKCILYQNLEYWRILGEFSCSSSHFSSFDNFYMRFHEFRDVFDRFTNEFNRFCDIFNRFRDLFNRFCEISCLSHPLRTCVSTKFSLSIFSAILSPKCALRSNCSTSFDFFAYVVYIISHQLISHQSSNIPI